MDDAVLLGLSNIVEDAHTSTSVLSEISISSGLPLLRGFGHIVLVEADPETLEFEVTLHLSREDEVVVFLQEVLLRELDWLLGVGRGGRVGRVRHVRFGSVRLFCLKFDSEAQALKLVRLLI